jgi:hypothetical protein
MGAPYRSRTLRHGVRSFPPCIPSQPRAADGNEQPRGDLGDAVFGGALAAQLRSDSDFRSGFLGAGFKITSNTRSNSASKSVSPAASAASLNRLNCSIGSSSGSLRLGIPEAVRPSAAKVNVLIILPTFRLYPDCEGRLLAATPFADPLHCGTNAIAHPTG